MIDPDGPIDEWLLSVPKITRTYLAIILLLAVLCHFEFVHPLQLYWNPKLFWQKSQVWRAVTNFLYFGQLNFDFLFHLFFLLRYFRILEEEAFANRPADFFLMLLFGWLHLLILGSILHVTFLSTAFTFMIVYVWSRKSPFMQMNFLGVFNFTAPWMPWVLLGFSMAMSGQVPTADLLGIVVGHLYYFFADIYPHTAGGNIIFRSPRWLCNLLGQPLNDAVQEAAVENEDNNEETSPSSSSSSSYSSSSETEDEGAGVFIRRSPRLAAKTEIFD